MRWNKTKLEIYQYLVGTHPYGGGKSFSPSKIADFLKKSRSYVYRITRQLEDEAFIYPIRRKTTPRLYNSTKKRPPVEKWFTKPEKSSGGVPPVGVNHFRGGSGGSPFTTSKSQWSCPISEPPKKDSGWAVKTLKNGVKHYFKEVYIDKPIGKKVLFQIVGKNNFTMTVTFPNFSFESIDNFRNSREIVKHLAMKAFRTVSRADKIPLKVKETRYSSGDFEHPLRDVDIKNFIDTATVTIKFKDGFKHVGKLDFDGSGKVEKIESDIPDWIADYSEIPSFSRRLQNVEKKFNTAFDDYFLKINKAIERTVSEKLDEMFTYNPNFKKELEGY